MPKMQLSYEPLGKTPNLIFEGAMAGMQEAVSYFNQGLLPTVNTPDGLKSVLDSGISVLCQDNTELRKTIKVTAPKPHPTTPNRRFINLIWDNHERVVVLAQITCVTQEGGES